jgi:hypothetical protein
MALFQRRPHRTHIPAKVPVWFSDYVKSNDEWCEAAYDEIKRLNREIFNSKPAAARIPDAAGQPPGVGGGVP